MRSATSLLLIFVMSCQPSEQEEAVSENIEEPPLRHITIDANLASRPVNLSELMEVERIVPLETRPDVLLPSNDPKWIARYITTNKYIIVLTHLAVFQFSIDGKYARILASEGNGPEEFTGINGFDVDRDLELLYYSNYSDRQHIAAIDLNSGDHLPKIPLPLSDLGSEGMFLNSLKVLPDHSLSLAIPMHFESDYAIVNISQSGELIGGNLRSEGTELANGNDWYQAHLGNQFYMKKANNDTLFIREDEVLRPKAVFRVADYHESITREFRLPGHAGGPPNETIWSIQFIGPGYYIIRCQALLRFPEGGYSPLDNRRIFVPGDTEAYLMENVIVDALGYALGIKALYNNGDFDYDLPLAQSDQDAIVYLDAYEFKEKAREVLAAGTASPEVLQRVRELDAQVTENSNPILLIGKMK